MSIDLHKELPYDKRFELSLALSILAQSFPKRSEWEVRSDVEKTHRYLSKFLNDLSPAPELDEYESEVSSAIHTYLRKYTDDPRSTMLWDFLHLNKGWGVWAAFVKGLVGNNFDLRDAWNAANFYRDKNDISDNQHMELLLRMWPEDEFQSMMEMFREDEWFEFKRPKNEKVKR